MGGRGASSGSGGQGGSGGSGSSAVDTAITIGNIVFGGESGNGGRSKPEPEEEDE